MKYHITPKMAALLSVVKAKRAAGQATEVLLTGVPGSGKTQFAYYISQQLQAAIYRYDCNIESNRSLMYEVDIAGVITRTAAFIHGPLWSSFEASHSQPVVILIDEVDKTSPDFDAFLLRTLEEKEFTLPCGNTCKGNAQNIVFVLTSNGRRELRTETLRRLLRINAEYPSVQVQQQICNEQCTTTPPPPLVALMVRIAEKLRSTIGYEAAPSPKEVVEATDMAMWLARDTDPATLAEVLAGKLVKNIPTESIAKAVGFDWVKAIRNEIR